MCEEAAEERGRLLNVRSPASEKIIHCTANLTAAAYQRLLTGWQFHRTSPKQAYLGTTRYILVMLSRTFTSE
jgi:hypothetical protein